MADTSATNTKGLRGAAIFSSTYLIVVFLYRFLTCYMNDLNDGNTRQGIPKLLIAINREMIDDLNGVCAASPLLRKAPEVSSEGTIIRQT